MLIEYNNNKFTKETRYDWLENSKKNQNLGIRETMLNSSSVQKYNEKLPFSEQNFYLSVLT